MAYSTCLRVAFALSLLALAAPSCNILGGACNCPELGDIAARASVPGALSSRIVVVKTDPACKAQVNSQAADEVDVSRDSTRTCSVLVQLANGEEFTFDASFTKEDLGCCGSRVSPDNTTVLERTDAAIQGRG